MGHRLDPTELFSSGCTSAGILLWVEGILFTPGERAPLFVEKNYAARATRYGDIRFCMGKQSKAL
jgi:hypothetical protein